MPFQQGFYSQSNDIHVVHYVYLQGAHCKCSYRKVLLVFNHLKSPKADSSPFNVETQCLPLLSVAEGVSLLRGEKISNALNCVAEYSREDLGHQPFLVSSWGTLHASRLIVKNITMNISKLSWSVEYLLQSRQISNLANCNLEILILVSPSQWHLSTYLEIFVFLPKKEIYSQVSFF